jgi:hypothetical protein
MRWRAKRGGPIKSRPAAERLIEAAGYSSRGSVRFLASPS